MKVLFENTPTESPAKSLPGSEGSIKRIALFGSTGSIGTQALNVIAANPEKFSAEVLTAQTNDELLIQQALQFNLVKDISEASLQGVVDYNYDDCIATANLHVWLEDRLSDLKKKHGDDQQTYGMEQMKLFREAGVNPLGGCMPALLQIPIFFALYSFFNSNIALRGESFLWANDLSVYDSILNLPFNIPFYGSHVSLFTLLAVITSFLISWYGMANAPDHGEPCFEIHAVYLPCFVTWLLQ